MDLAGPGDPQVKENTSMVFLSRLGESPASFRPKSARPSRTFGFAAFLGGLLLAASSASADIPVGVGSKEIQIGVAGIVLPENSLGTYSLQPEVRVGWFIREAVEVVLQGDVRVWPLGEKAANSYGAGVALAFFPKLNETHNLYLLGGVGGAYADPPGAVDAGFDPLVRAGFGFKVPVAGLPLLPGAYLNVEYRGEFVLADENDFVSGAALGLSFFK